VTSFCLPAEMLCWARVGEIVKAKIRFLLFVKLFLPFGTFHKILKMENGKISKGSFVLLI
jgi:hypothetical protein